MPPIDLEEFGIDEHQERIVLERERLEEIVAYSYYKGRFAGTKTIPINVCMKGALLRVDATPPEIAAAKKGLIKLVAEHLAENCITVYQHVLVSAVSGANAIALQTDFWYVNNAGAKDVCPH